MIIMVYNFEPGSLNDLKEKVKILIANKNLCLEYGENAFKDFNKYYTRDKIIID